MSVSVVGELSSVRRRPHWTLPTAMHCIMVVALWNFAALTLTFLVSVLCGVTPTKSTMLPIIWGCTYLSSVAFTPLILCLSYCYFCSCRCSIDFSSQITEHFHFAELLLYQILAEYLSTRNKRENQFDDNDAPSKVMEVQIMSASSRVSKPTKYMSSPYLTQESSNHCINTLSQTQQSKIGTSARSVENPLSADDQPLSSLLQQMFCYYLVPNAIATLFGTSIFSILSILDWGSQIQRWPVPMILGATVGHVCGTAYVVLGFVSCTVFNSKSTTNAPHSYHHDTVLSSKME